MIRTFYLLGFFIIVVCSDAQSNFLPEEIRLGALKHDIKTGCRHSHEKGYDGNAEFLWTSPQDIGFQYIYYPRPHIGLSLNPHGGTHQLYFGLTWRYEFLTYLFVEGAFGGDINTGGKNKSSHRKKALGSNFMFHEGVSLGVQMTDAHSLSLFLDHTSNASLGKCNPGLTSLGLRYGYKF